MNAAVQDFEELVTATPPPHPQVFVRAFTTPPGAPWEQARAADMDARHGAPLPVADLLFRIRRLAGWAPGRPGRFAVFYVRAQEFREPFETEVDVDGQRVKVSFGTSGEQMRRLRLIGLGLGLLVAVGALLGGGLMMALSARAEVNARIEALEQQSEQRLRAAKAFQRQKELAQELSAAVGRSGRMRDVLGDLAWVATSKTSDARVVAVHWERGVLAVEARGEQAPFAAPDRRVERFDKPLRPGVWLWGVSHQGAGREPAGAIGR